MHLDTEKLAVEWVATSRLFCSPANPRRNDDAVPHVAASMRRFGWRQPIVARPSGEVIAGNTRLKAAQSLGMAGVPVAWFEGTDLDATAYAIADNRTHEFAEWDDQSLARILEQLRSEDALDGVGYSNKDIDALLAELARPARPGDRGLRSRRAAGEPGLAPRRPLLGGHRLLCGDSTVP